MRFNPVRLSQKLHLGLAGWLLGFSLLGLGGLALAPTTTAASSSNCDPVNIVLCGLDTTSLQTEIDSFQADYQHNSNNGHTDLKTVYRWAGATDSSVSNMNTSNTKSGTMFRNGDITVNGKTVGTDAWVAARFRENTGTWVQVSPGVWARKTTTSLAEASAPVIVHFSGGQADFAVMVNCANAVKFTPPPAPTPPPQPKPQLVCNNLDAKQVGSSEQFNFHATASASHTTITKYVFDYGDGHQQTVNTGNEASDTQHTYSGFGQTFHARVTVFSNDFSSGKTSANCTATIVLPGQPSLKCVAVTPAFTSNPLTVQFTATAAANQAKISSYTFAYSDGTQKVLQTGATTASDTHTFAQNNTAYTLTVTILGTTTNGQQITAKACTTSFTTPAPNECKPGIPVGSPECTTTTTPTQPTALLNTGPGHVFGAAAGVTVIASSARFFYLRRKFGL